MSEQKNNLSTPMAIVFAGFLIAGGIYFTNKEKTPTAQDNTGVNPPVTNNLDIKLDPVSSTDHLLGNPNAPITIVEYSDTECPYCRMFQTNMQTIMSTYGKDGQIAWVYRHFPLDQLHSKTRKEAEATECVNELGGNTAFWKMLDAIYANTPSNNGLDAAKLPEFAIAAGIDVTKFNSCLSSGKYKNLVEANFQSGVKAGAQGTPYNIMVLKSALSSGKEKEISDYILKNNVSLNIMISSDKKEIVLNGALPVDMIKAVADIVLK